MYLQQGNDRNTQNTNYLPLKFPVVGRPSLEYYTDCIGFYNKVKDEVGLRNTNKNLKDFNSCDPSECNGCKDCSLPDPNRFEIGLYLTSDGDILDIDIEILWYEQLLGQYDEIKKSKQFLLYDADTCARIMFPNGNSHCCYTIRATRRSDKYVNAIINVSNNVKFPNKFVHIILARSGDDIKFEITNKPKSWDTC